MVRLSTEQRMALGRRLHEKEADAETLAKEHGVHKSVVFAAQRAYRLANGLPIDKPRTKATPGKKTISARDAFKSKTETVKKTIVEKPDWRAFQVQVAIEPQDLLLQLKEVQAERDQAMHECEILRKLLMTVGAAL